MPHKIKIIPPKPTKTMFIVLIVLGILFLLFGLVLFFSIQSDMDDEARPFIALFFLIWSVACVAIVVHGIKVLKLIKKGKIEIGEISAVEEESKSDFAKKLYDLDTLKKDGIISDDEYNRKRKEIMNEKW